MKLRVHVLYNLTVVPVLTRSFYAMLCTLFITTLLNRKYIEYLQPIYQTRMYLHVYLHVYEVSFKVRVLAFDN